MIIEQAVLYIRTGEGAAFEAAMAEAKPLIAASPGFHGIEVLRACGQDDLYLLMVKWDSVSDHRDGFRKSERYLQWRALLHKFYDPMPDIRYFGESL